MTKPPGEDPAKQGDTAMEQQTTIQASSSSPMGERLETCVREQVQRCIQALLEAEGTAV